MKDANRNLALRLASAAVLVPGLLFVTLWRRPEGMAIAVHGMVLIGLLEFYWIALRDDPIWMRICSALLGVGLSVTMVWCHRPDEVVAVLMLATLAIAVMHLMHLGQIETAATRTAVSVFGLIYLPLFLTSVALIKQRSDGVDWLLLLFTVTWLSDTGAYFTGRAFGHRRLYPAVSPKKSVEGAVGGLAASIGSAVVAKLWYMPQLAWHDALIIGTVAGAVGQIGDLVESMIKRGYNVKDSGWIIPGHGGVLDRIDALLFTAPVVYLYATYLFGGGH